MIQTTLDRALEAFAAVNAIRSMVKGMDALHVFHLKNRLKDINRKIDEAESAMARANRDEGVMPSSIENASKNAKYFLILFLIFYSPLPCASLCHPRLPHCPPGGFSRLEIFPTQHLKASPVWAGLQAFFNPLLPCILQR